MHKKIAKIIEKIVKESPYTHFKCKVTPNNTEGFWKLILTFESRDDAHSESLIKSLHHIGQVYGESLDIRDEGRIVRVQ